MFSLQKKTKHSGLCADAAETVGFFASLTACLASGLRSLVAALPGRIRRLRRQGYAVRNRRAASLPLASLVAHWAFASLLPALRALGFALRIPSSVSAK